MQNKLETEPLISVIILIHNDQKWLKKCFDSLFAQTYKNLEIIVFDNASTDGGPEFLRKHYPDIKIIFSSENLGPTIGTDLGIKKAKEELILVLDNDVWFEPDFIEKMFQSFKKNKCVVLAPLETEFFNPQFKKYISVIDFLGHQCYFFDQKFDKPSFYFSACCLFFEKRIYLQSGGFDLKFIFCAEPDWFWRLHLLKKRIYQDKKIFIHHAAGRSGWFGRGRGRFNYRTFFYRNRSALQTLLKNYAWYTLLWVLPLYFWQNIIEILFFLAIFQPKIAATYIMGLWFNIKDFKRIMKKRARIQKNRKIGDIEIFKKMYLGFGKFYHLKIFFSRWNEQ